MSKKLDRLDIMLDLETLGNSDKPVLTQLAAVAFSLESGETFSDFNHLIKPQSCVKAGLTCAPRKTSYQDSTLDFWLRQDEETFNQVILKAFTEGKDLGFVLKEFSQWIDSLKKQYGVKTIKVYGNGPAADCVWLRSAYDAVNLEAPWKYWDDADVRTYVDLGIRKLNFNPKKDMVFEGKKHDAIDDCKHQIKYVCAIYKKLG